MKNLGPTLAFVAATFALATGVSAQDSPGVSANPRLPLWEIGGSLGSFMMRGEALDAEQRTDSADRHGTYDWIAVAYGLGLGHYLTPHLKIEMGFLQRSQHDTIDVESARLKELPTTFAPVLIVTAKTVDLTTVSVGAAYQFRENAFFHPYVSAGVRLGWLREHRVRDQLDGSSPFPYSVLALDEHTYQLVTRPVVGGGFKWYFTPFAFLRPEASLALGPGGLSDTTFGVSFGRDF